MLDAVMRCRSSDGRAHSALTAGDFEHDEFQGSGNFHATNGDHYEGAWQAGKQVLMLGVRCAFSLLLAARLWNLRAGKGRQVRG